MHDMVSGRGILAQPPSFSLWQSDWTPQKIEFKGWVTDWSLEHTQVKQDDKTKDVMDEIEVAASAENKGKID